MMISSARVIRLGAPARSEALGGPHHRALSEFLAKSFLNSVERTDSFLNLIREFDHFFHVLTLRKYKEEDLPRILLARHSTEREIVFDFPGTDGTEALVQETLTSIAYLAGFDAKIECKSVMTIYGKANRYFVLIS